MKYFGTIFKTRSRVFANNSVSLIVMSLSLLFSFESEAGNRRLKIGDKFPKFSLETISNVPNRHSDLKNKVTVYDLSASWTKGTAKALRHYKKLLKKYGRNGLKVIVINTDENKKDADKFIEKIKPSYPVFYDGNHKFIRTIDPPGFPVVYIANQNGIIKDVIRDYCENEFDLLEKRIVEQFKK